MAEKEERILIGKDIESPCVKCKVELCAEKCEEYERFVQEFKPSICPPRCHKPYGKGNGKEV